MDLNGYMPCIESGKDIIIFLVVFLDTALAGFALT